jgi:hypothetical protein
MSFLSFLRQYGAREYGVTLGVAAVAGLALAVLINSGPGGGREPALLRTPPQEVAKTVATRPKVIKPAPVAKATARRTAVHRRRHAHRAVRRAVVTAAVPRARPERQASGPTTASTPPTTPTPVVQAPPAPKPSPAPVRKAAPKKSGGGIQFDDSG